MTTTWTAVEERIAWTATEDPSYQFVTLRPTTVTLESGGDGGGAVDSVNGATGTVVLDAGDVGADPAGTAAGLVDDLSGVTNAATARSNLGLGNVNNTSDANKPVSSAQQTALDGKAAASHSHSGADITSGTVATARLGTGAANATTFLRGDQTWAAVPDEVPTITPIVQLPYYSQPGPYSTSHASLTMPSRASWTAIWLGPGTYDAVGIWVVTTSTTTFRLCLDTVGADGLPGVLVRDAGTLDCSTTTGLRMLTFGSTLTITESTWYWCRVVCTAYTSPPSLSCLNAAGGNSWPPWPGMGDSASYTNRAVAGFLSTAQPTGPDKEPSTPDALQGAASVRVWLRRSA